MSHENNDMSDELWEKAKISLKIYYKHQMWWSAVQDEVKQSLFWVIDNLPHTSRNFVDVFYSLFTWECTKRIIEGKSIAAIDTIQDDPVSPVISEECYQCGMNPTKVILELQDWTKPNDFDVLAALLLTQKIESLMNAIEEIDKNEKGIT